MSRKYILDAAESAFFDRDLDSKKTQLYNVKYPDLKASLFIPVDTSTNPGAKTITYEQQDAVGRARIVHSGSTDSPRVDVLGTEFTKPVRRLSASYGFDILDIRSAAMAGTPLEMRKALQARRAIEELLDFIACFGDTEYGIVDGFLNDSNVTIEAAAGVWSGATPTAIIADITDMLSTVSDDTLGIEQPDTLLLPDSEFLRIATQQLTNTSITTLQFILQNVPQITSIEPWYRLNLADAAGTGPRGVLYKKDPLVLTQDIPSPFEVLPVFQHGSNFEVETMATTGGTTLYYPKGVQYIDGI